jgi:modulator of FtsH protease HflK
MAQSARRAEAVSLGGLSLQILFFAITLLVALWNGSYATFAAAFYVLGGVIIWAAILLVFHQVKLVRLEALESEQIERDRQVLGAEALFDEGRGPLGMVRVAQARLEWMQKWLVPLFGLLASLYLIGMGAYLHKGFMTYPIGAEAWPEVANASLTLAFVGGVAFVSFLFSRYTVGMARVGRDWRLLRAGGSYLTGNALISGLTAAMLGFVAYGKSLPEQVFAKTIPVVMVLVGAEIILNLVLDIYRPRRPGEISRAAFDSRLLGLVSEPGGIARTIAEAVNYQFGFEVSKTWFYQLLQRWALVLVGAAIGIIFLMTCLVIVEPGEEAVIERFGSPLGLEERSIVALGPGPHLKYPWPIDQATRYPVDRIRTVQLGFGQWKDPKRAPRAEEVPSLILWTSGIHGPGEELDFVLPVKLRPGQERLAASRPTSTSQEGAGEGLKTPAVNLLRIDLPILYRVKDLYQYAFQYSNPETLIESAAYGEMVRYVASRDLDELLAVSRTQAANDLRRLIQLRCDHLGVGVEITAVGLQNIHPPQPVAKEFEAYLNARYEAGEALALAEGEATKMLTQAADSRRLAEQLAESINLIQRLNADGAPEKDITRAREAVEVHFAGQAGVSEGASGMAAEIVSMAKAERWMEENLARGRVASFKKELAAYRASPQLYKVRRYVEVMINGLRDANKYVIARDGEVFLRYDSQEREKVQLEDIDYNLPPG